MNQEQLVFQNTDLRSIGGFWKHYPYKSSGSILHWMYVYGSLHIAEQVKVGNGVLTLHNKPFATFTFDEELRMPIFVFDDVPEKRFMAQAQQVYLEELRKINQVNHY